MATSDAAQISEQGSGEVTKSVFKNGMFWNPWDTWSDEKPKLFKMIREKDNSNVPSQSALDEQLPVIKPDPDVISSPPKTGIRTTWIGHATVLAQFDGITVLTDPIWTETCGPTYAQWIGPKRQRRVPLKVDELPKIDAVVISHSHFDHLSQPTVRELNKKFGKDLHWFVPLRLADWMKAEGCETVTELDWWEEGHMESHPGVTFACTPTQHWGQRTAFDSRKVLWGSWLIKGPHHSFYFAGDSAYCKAFKEIGQRYGPIDLAAIPVGATEPRWFMANMHCNIPEAVQMHQDLQAKKSLAIHWGTFKLSKELFMAPLTEIKIAMEEAGLSAADFRTKNPGEIWHLFGDNLNEVD